MEESMLNKFFTKCELRDSENPERFWSAKELAKFAGCSEDEAQAALDEWLDDEETEVINEVYHQANYDLEGNRRG